MASPFRFDGPLDPEDRSQLIGRAGDIETLTTAALDGEFMCVYAPRRYGKTSLLKAVLADATMAHHLIGVYVDLLGVVSLTDLAVRLDRAYDHALPAKVRRSAERFFARAGLRGSISLGSFGVEVRREPRTDPTERLHRLLELPAQLGERVLVVLDEFQAVMAVPGAEGLIRSHAQQPEHRKYTAYAFAGSEPGLMRQAFSDRKRPLYGQATQLRLGRLPAADTLDLLQARFTATGRDLGECGALLVADMEGHPQRTMLLAHLLWRRTPAGTTSSPDDYDAAAADALAATRYESETRWRDLSPNGKRLLRAIIEYGAPATLDALTALSLSKGSVSKTQELLEADGDIERADDHAWRVVDPLFAAWIQRLGR